MSIYSQILNDDIKIIDKLFQFKRIVDPVKKYNLEKVNDDIDYDIHKCYSFWEKDHECDNCISMRSYNENKTFSKIEYVRDRIYIVMSTPININEDRYIVELLRDITDDDLRKHISKNQGESIEDAFEEIKRLNNLAIIDDLTNMFNRRYINEKIPVEINNSVKKGQDLSLAIMDIDDFKHINDNYGHICGDYVLEKISSILISNIKGNGWVGRYGGDEFILLFNCDIDKSYSIVENIRKDIEKSHFDYDGQNIKVTCSFGISSVDEYVNDAKSFIKASDKKLLESKRKNKNIISI